MPSAGERLTVQQREAVKERLRGTNVTDIATKVGVSRQTVHKWFLKPEIVAYYEELGRDYIALRKGRYLAVLEDLTATMLSISSEVRERLARGDMPTPEMTNSLTRALVELAKREEAAGIPTADDDLPKRANVAGATILKEGAAERLRKMHQKPEADEEAPTSGDAEGALTDS